MGLEPEALSNERKLFLPLSRRQCQHRALAGAQADSGGCTREIRDGRGYRQANYAKLDESTSPVRIRLNSTAVRVKHAGDPARATDVEIAYARGGKVYTAKSGHCILACWNVVIPYICEELPQRREMRWPRRRKSRCCTAMCSCGTRLRFRSWERIRSTRRAATIPTLTWTCRSALGSIAARAPEDPLVVHMSKAPCHAGLPARDQHIAGRMELYTTTFETIERKIREQLARTLGPGGFDPARDILAITANRWPHGYAYEYSSLWDKFVLEGGETPCEIARKPYGRIAIANSDAGAYAYTDEAINQAWRAVGEITKSSFASSSRFSFSNVIPRLKRASAFCGSSSSVRLNSPSAWGNCSRLK
jgi:spermidine dehydrogenase